MKKARILQFLAVTGAVAGLNAQAGFVNGGFEDGNLNGWSVRYGNNYGVGNLANPVGSVSWGGWSYASSGKPAGVVAAGTTDSYVSGGLGSLILGNYAARLNDINGYYHVTQISQTGNITAADLTGGATSASLYVNWAGVMDDPLHAQSAEPWFVTEVYANGSLFFREIQYANQHSGGWTRTGTYGGDPIYSKSGQVVVNGLSVGDSVEVVLTVADCALGGHGAYAYLDGIGTAYVPPPTPDGGLTSLMLGTAFAGLSLIRRKLS
jgi:hypothetical protein